MHEDPLIRDLAAERREAHPEVSVDEMAIRILVENLQSRIRFVTLGPGVYKVIVADYDAENAQLLARWISELFVDVSDQEALDRIRAAHEFGAEQLRIYEDQLQRSEAALERYKKSMIERDLTQSVVRGENLAAAEALLRRIEDERTAARIRVRPQADVVAQLDVEPPPSALREDVRIADLAQGLQAALEGELVDRLAAGVAEVGEWQPPPAYSALRGELLQAIETTAAEVYTGEPEAVVDDIARYLFLTVDFEAHRAAASMLASAIARYKQRAESTPGGEIELTRLESEVEMNRRLLQSFQAQLVASDVSQAVEVTKLGLQIEILDPARLPLSPSRPDRRKILVAALFLGVLLGVGIAFLGETVDPVLRSLGDFRRAVPVTVLGTTPLLARVIDRRSWMRRHWVAVTVSGLVAVTALFFAVRTNVLHDLAAANAPVQVINPEGLPDEDR